MSDRNESPSVSDLAEIPVAEDTLTSDPAEYEDRRTLQEQVHDFADEMVEHWDRMRDTIGPF